MKAVVMAGGEGSRLRPLTLGRPKPMIPLVNKPVLGHILDLLKRHDIIDVVITLQYLADRIKDYYGDGSNLGMNITYSEENTPLGTAGSVKRAAHLLDETFLVISGDALTDFDLSRALCFHKENQAVATLMLARVQNPLEYGVVQTDESGRIERFSEKPSWSEVMSDTVNTGIYVLEPEVLARIEPNVACDFGHDLFQQMLEERQKVLGFVGEGYWTDIGRLEEYVRATNDILYGKVQVEPLGEHIGGDIWVDGDRDIAPDAQLYGPIFLGSEVKIKGGVVIRGPVVIRDNVVVDTRANIERSIIWRNCYIGERVEVRGALIGLQCSIKARAMLFEGVVISDNTVVRENAVIQPNVKIWPQKEVEAGATVTSSIIWGSQGKRNLFGRYGVTGMVNVELTPDFCAKIGAAFGSVLPKGATVALNREAHNTPRVLKRALLSGLPSAGIHALDTATQPIPVVRFYTRDSESGGGLHVRLSPYDNRVVDIKFFGSDGLDLSQRVQRNIETIFFREDYRRVYLDEIGQIDYPDDVVQRYHQRFMASLQSDLWPLPEGYDLVVIDYANASAALVLPDLLTQLRCDVVAVNTLLDQNLLFRTRPQWESGMSRLGAITQALAANFGVRLDVGAERLYLAADDGSLISDLDALIAVTQLLFMVRPGAMVGVPATAPHILDHLAEQHGGQIRRLKIGQNAHMRAATTGEFAMIGDERGAFIFPDFTPFPDGMFAIAKIMEMTAQAEQSLSDIWRARSAYHLARARIPCRWEVKGRVMRLLRERLRNEESDSAEGIQIEMGAEWVLILPDPEEPFFWVHAEGESPESAKELVDKYHSLVNALIQE
ncbi:MAG: NTP transferase domain-containing protein [Ardenticatenales bacterium]|nr:NTP transferase domain-containing protein [Ardenticatenales bacterium]